MRSHRSELGLAWAAMAKDRLAVAGLVIFATAVLAAVLAPLVSPYHPDVASETAGRLAHLRSRPVIRWGPTVRDATS